MRSAARQAQQAIGSPHESSATPTVLPEVRYVITLDTDTQLPRDSAREMVGAMAHPLNRPVFDPSAAGSSPATASCSRASA